MTNELAIRLNQLRRIHPNIDTDITNTLTRHPTATIQTALTAVELWLNQRLAAYTRLETIATTPPKEPTMTDSPLIPVADNLPYPLGRAGVHHDPHNYNHRALVQPPPRTTTPHRPWFTNDIYNQGQTSSCTAQAAIGCLRTHPFRQSFKPDWPAYDQPDERHTLYLEAQHHDPWPGTAYNGSSTDAPFKVLRQRGHITGWKWLFGETELREFVTWYGPAVVGTLWYHDMFTPDTRGYIHPTGTKAGGHAYRLVQYSKARDAYRIANSWGRGWGQNGRAWISSTDLATLLAREGEAVTIA